MSVDEKRAHTRDEQSTYDSWRGTIGRCHDPHHDGYAHYGGSGIGVCIRWRSSFAAFLFDMGRRPSRAHTLDRIDNERGYEPGNCRWATAREQQRNRRNNRRLSAGGETLLLVEWAERLGVSENTLWTRVSRGWSDADVVGRPVKRMSQEYRIAARIRSGT